MSQEIGKMVARSFKDLDTNLRDFSARVSRGARNFWVSAMPKKEGSATMMKQEAAPSRPKPGFTDKEKLALEAGMSLFLAGVAHFADAGAHYLKHGDLDDYRFPEERLATWMYDFVQLNFGPGTSELPGFVEASRTPEGVVLITGTPIATATFTPEPSPTPTRTVEPTPTNTATPELTSTPAATPTPSEPLQFILEAESPKGRYIVVEFTGIGETVIPTTGPGAGYGEFIELKAAIQPSGEEWVVYFLKERFDRGELAPLGSGIKCPTGPDGKPNLVGQVAEIYAWKEFFDDIQRQVYAGLVMCTQPQK